MAMNERRNEHRRKDDLSQTETMRIVRHWGRQVAVAYLTMLTIAVVAVAVSQNDTSNLTDRLHNSELGSCRRLDVQRAETNASNLASWNFYQLVIHLTATSKNRNRKLALAFAAQLQGYANDVEWTPLTVCRLAVDHPLAYVAPLPRPFYLNRDGTLPEPIIESISIAHARHA